MAKLKDIERYCNERLDCERFQDYAPNGIQVEGRSEVRRLVAGVTASLDLIEAAIAADADAIIVHHGYFWKNEAPVITGMKRRRLQKLLGHDVSLLAYHLPLDAHPEIGNNVELARRLGIEVEGELGNGGGLALRGVLSRPLSAKGFADRIGKALGRTPLHLPGGAEEIRRVGWCTGAADGYCQAAAEAGMDAYISGEVSEQTFHVCRETGIHYFAAGHHATERYGICALAKELAGYFDLDWRFIDVDNPV